MQNKSVMVKAMVAASVVALSGLAAVQTARAALIYDLEATSLNGSALSSGNTSKSVAVHAGDIVGYSVFATMSTGTSGTDGFQSGNGQILSTGSILGNLTQTNNATFAAPSFSNGVIRDIDGDGDLDVGGVTGNPPTNPDGIAYIAAGSVAGNNILLGTGTFTVTSLGAGGNTIVNFSSASSTTLNKNPLWTENGSSFTASTGVIGAPSGFTLTAAGAATPEPASLGILALGGVALLARRRKA